MLTQLASLHQTVSCTYELNPRLTLKGECYEYWTRKLERRGCRQDGCDVSICRHGSHPDHRFGGGLDRLIKAENATYDEQTSQLQRNLPKAVSGD